MRSSHTRSTVSRNCKGCGERFTVTGDTITSDLARGLSKPARCPKCRKSHGRFVNSVGSGYFLEKRMGTPHPQCMGKFGLALLDHPEPKVDESSYEVEPSPEQLEKFKVLEPAVKALIGNLEDPNGTSGRNS